MCGIFGYLGDNESFSIILSGLKILLNRGYDSAGIATSSLNNINISKFASINNNDCISKLEKCSQDHKKNYLGIGHTRWATHGSKSDQNSHPHLDYQNKFCLVHNGIIENYIELKEDLIKKGVTFRSQTDTEIIVNLISYLYSQNNNFYLSIVEAQNLLLGTWGVVVINIEQPNIIYCFRNGSPLCIGLDDSKQNVYISSESRSFNQFCNKYFKLINKEILVLEKLSNTKKIVKIDNLSDQKHPFNFNSFQIIKNNLSLNSPEPFNHWTIKEIYDQVDTLQSSYNYGGRLDKITTKFGGLDENKKVFGEVTNLIIIGCGSSLNAGEIGKYYFKYLSCFNNVYCIDSSELSYLDFNHDDKTMLICLSQSGETIDSIMAINKYRHLCQYIFTIVNVVGSSLSEMSNSGAYLNCGIEMGVASTKSFTSQCLVLLLIAIWFSYFKNKILDHSLLIEKILDLPINVNKILNNYQYITNICSEIKKKKNFFILSGGVSRFIAEEAALKIKELSYLNCNSYQISSLKHGPFALIDSETIIIFIASYYDSDIYRKTLIGLDETKTRGSYNIFITDNYNLENNKSIDYLINVPPSCLLTFPILAIVPLQIISYKLAILQDLNPDFPRNLAKSVTVE